MIQKLRWKFIAINMVLVTLVLASLFAVVMVSTHNSLSQDSRSALEQAIGMNNHRPFYNSFEIPEGGAILGDERIQLPYLTAEVTSGGQAYILYNQFFDTSDDEALLAVLESALQDPDSIGEIQSHGYHLRFLRAETILGTRLAFVDLTQERSTLYALGRNMTFICLGTLALFFLISLLLARWAVRPVERSWKQQRQFVADASHELKTPLTVILSSLDMLDEFGDSDPEKSRRWMDNIRASSGQMRKLVEEMLVLARSDNATQQLTPRPCDFTELVQEQLLFFEPIAFEGGKTLAEELHPGVRVVGDESLLRRIVAIYLDNACKYGAANSVISVRLKADGKRIVLSVTSEGSPIPKEHLEHIFERFYRLDPSRTEEGYGLGLSIAMELARLHHGKVWATSNEGGNTFYLSLPKEKSV